MENTIKIFWNGVKLNGKLQSFNFSLNNDPEKGEHVSFYAKGYDHEMPAECGVEVINNSDGMTDYFEEDHGTICQDHPLYRFFKYAAIKGEIHACERMIRNYTAKIGLRPYYAEWAEEKKAKKAELEKFENPGQPTAEDFEKVAAYLAENKAKAEVEKKAEEEREEQARAAAREHTKKIVSEKIETFTKAFPLVDGAPVVEIGWSEMYGLPGGGKDECLRLSVAAADRILGALDDWQHRVRVGSSYYGWYHKTDFAIKWTENGEECAYRGRYDLGDGEGGLLAHIRNFGEWSRTHGEFGKVLENPPETNEVLEMLKKFEAVAA